MVDALKRYEAQRRDLTAEIILKARQRANMIHGKNPEETERWYQELAQEDGQNILSAIGKTILKGPFH